MARTPRPWFWKKRQSWFVTIAGKRHNLGRDRHLAKQRFHELMAKPVKREVASDSVAAIIDSFLEWTKSNRSEATYGWYTGQREFDGVVQQIVDQLPQMMSVSLYDH